MIQTLQLQERIHPKLKIDNSDDLEIFKKESGLILLYDIFKPGDETGVGYVAIKDSNNIHEFDTKLFFLEKQLNDIFIHETTNSNCGYIDSHLVSTNIQEIFDKLNIKNNKSKKNELDYDKLTSKEKAIFQAYLKTRIIEVERKSDISPLEIFLLDTIEMNRRRYKKYDFVKNIKDLCKWYNFKEMKLRSGLQRRTQCRRWAKKDFLDNNKKFILK